MEELKKKFLSRENLSILLSDRKLVFSLLLGLILIAFGVFFFKNAPWGDPTTVEVLETTTVSQEKGEITVEIAGEVVSPGVYKMSQDSRVEDLLTLSGGLSANANRDWVEKYLNRAAKLTDSQKIYIPSQSEPLSAKNVDYIKGEQPVLGVNQSSLVNINTATLSELDKLPGIGPVYGQSIIDHRPYSNIEELTSKGAIKQSVYNKIKNLISVY